jgi:heat shock protein HslJ
MEPKRFFMGRAIGLLVVLAIAGVVAAFYAFNNYIYEQKQGYATDDHKDAEYVIEGTRVRLMDGVAETEVDPGSASKVVTRYFGNELTTDLDSDGREDKIFLLTQNAGGSGTFYYVVAALNTDRGYVGSEALLLGDRIAPQTTEKGEGKVVVVNYADRAPGEPLAATPTVGKSIWLLLDAQAMQFGEVEQDFEGEVDPSRMSLAMKTWTWISATYNDGREVRPAGTEPFTLTFESDGTFTATTDCNSMSGSYTADTATISFSEIAMTKMYCEGSQEAEFVALLQNTAGYHFTSRGELIFDLKFDSGSVLFR